MIFFNPLSKSFYNIPLTQKMPLGGTMLESLSGERKFVDEEKIAPFILSRAEVEQKLSTQVNHAARDLRKYQNQWDQFCKIDESLEDEFQAFPNLARAVLSLLGFPPEHIQFEEQAAFKQFVPLLHHAVETFLDQCRFQQYAQPEGITSLIQAVESFERTYIHLDNEPLEILGTFLQKQLEGKGAERKLLAWFNEWWQKLETDPQTAKAMEEMLNNISKEVQDELSVISLASESCT